MVGYRPMKKLPLLATLAAFLGTVPSATASLVRAMGLAELTAAADKVVVGDVAKVESQWDRDHRNIYTTIEIAVQESWKGTAPANGRILVRQPGGTVGEIEMTVIGMPTFSVGERAVLFLEKASVVGMGQGKRPMRWDQASKQWFVEPGQADGAVRTDRGGQLRSATRPAGESRESIDSLRAKVRALLEK
jgi:hypothetical protein